MSLYTVYSAWLGPRVCATEPDVVMQDFALAASFDQHDRFAETVEAIAATFARSEAETGRYQPLYLDASIALRVPCHDLPMGADHYAEVRDRIRAEAVASQENVASQEGDDGR